MLLLISKYEGTRGITHESSLDKVFSLVIIVYMYTSRNVVSP